MDTIHLDNLRLQCIVGILPNERKRKRTIVVHLRLKCDLHKAGRTDSITDTIDYRDVQRRVEDCVAKSKDGLIERLAQRIADSALSVRGVKEVTVILEKPKALPRCESVAVEITRVASSKRSIPYV